MGEEEIIALRREKLERLRARGIDPYPQRFRRTHTAQEAIDLLGEGDQGPEVTVAGRVMATRNMGRATFLDLRDGSGRLQVYLKRDTLGDPTYEVLHDIDLGDFLGVAGTLFRTKTGEPTVEAKSLTLLAKALRPPPEKWHGLHDVEVRYRQRHLDLMANEEAREMVITRSKVVAALRRFLDSRGYLEVEKPVLKSVPGGAAAR